MARLGPELQRVFSWQPSETHLRRIQEPLARAVCRPGQPDWYSVPERVRSLDPEGICALLGYGSWYLGGLRKPTSFADVYVVVDDYRSFHARAFHAWMNRRLPPNVYYLWSEGEGHRNIRGKYNVISREDLERECGPGLRDLYSAGRLSKRVWLAWSRDEATRGWLLEQILRASCTLTPLALAFLPERFDLDAFSHQLLALSYRGEARLEGWERIRALHATDAAVYREIHTPLLAAFGAATGLVEVESPGYRRRPSPHWPALELRARALVRRSRRRGYLRWPRIVLTERNLLDLAVNEAERKAGVRVRVTPRLRRHPLLYGLPEFRRVLRERNTRERIRGHRD